MRYRLVALDDDNNRTEFPFPTKEGDRLLLRLAQLGSLHAVGAEEPEVAASNGSRILIADVNLAGRTIMEYADAAYDRLGGRPVTPQALTDQMLLDGWTTKSPNPVDIVAATLREKRQGSRRYEPVGEGRWERVSADKVVKQSYTPIRQPEPGQASTDYAARALKAHGRLTPRELLQAVNAAGYHTDAKDPLGNLNSALYRNKKRFAYDKENGQWRLLHPEREP